MLKFLLSLTSITCFSLLGYAQSEEVTIIEKDLDLFIETYEPLVREFENLGEDYDEIRDPSALQALMANEKVNAILEKYGWDTKFGMKWVAIASAYSYIKMDEEISKLPPDQQDQFKSIVGTKLVPYDVSEDMKKLIQSRIEELDKLFND